MPKLDSFATNSYKYGSILVKYRFFFVFPPFFPGFSPKVTPSISVFKKHLVFFDLPKNRLTLYLTPDDFTHQRESAPALKLSGEDSWSLTNDYVPFSI
jgi:hypothetical protein